MKYSVAVIIPTLNEEYFIADCLKSVFEQTFSMDEMDIMVVDGGSKDRTKNIVDEISKEYSNVRVLNNPHKIQSVAFNIGVKNSTAPYVIRLDAHTLYDKNYIALCIKYLQNSKYGNVGGRWSVLGKDNTLVAKANAILNQMKFGIGGAEFRTSQLEADVDTVPFGAFRREVLEIVGPMNERLPRGEDNEFNARIRAKGFLIHFDPRIIATYYARNTFLGSVKQMFNNGFSIGVLLRTYVKSVNIRHIIPLIFTLSLIVLAIMSFFCKCFLILFGIELGLYFILNIISCLFECNKFGMKYLIVLPILIFCVHISYGLGTLKGLYSKKY